MTSAARTFRLRGFGGAGVDAVAKDAGLTSGAIYEHYGSKATLFRATMVEGMHEFRDGVTAFAKGHKGPWIVPFAKWYLSKERRENLAESCALATLTLDTARSDDQTRDAYDEAFAEIVDVFKREVGSKENAIAILALLSGGLAIAHATHNGKLSDRVAASIVDAISELV